MESNTPKLILIVEDDSIATMVARRIFEGLGCQVDHAKDGQQAVDLACERDYACIVVSELPNQAMLSPLWKMMGWRMTKLRPLEGLV